MPDRISKWRPPSGLRLSRGSLPTRHLQFRQLLHHVVARRGGVHAAIDEENPSIGADVEGVPGGVAGLQDAVGLRRPLVGVAEDRIVEAQGLGELAIGVRVIDAGGEVGDLEIPDLRPARTERLAFRRSSAGERLGKPGDDDRLLPPEVR
jgi:hypothetical protein